MKHKDKSLFLKLAAPMAMLLTGACATTDVTTPSLSDAQVRPEVEMVRLTYAIGAATGEDPIPAVTTLDGLHRFLGEIDAGYGDRIYLDVGSETPDRRIKAIEQFIRARGLEYGGTQILGPRPDKGAMTLYVERHIVITSNCGEWQLEVTRSQRNNPSSFHGCATTSSLARMVASPRDMVDGQSGETNSAAAIRAVNALQNKPLATGSAVLSSPRASSTGGLSGSRN